MVLCWAVASLWAEVGTGVLAYATMIMPNRPAASTTAPATTIFQLGTNLRQPPRPSPSFFVGGPGGSGGCPEPRLRERRGASLMIVSWLPSVRVSWLRGRCGGCCPYGSSGPGRGSGLRGAGWSYGCAAIAPVCS
ncbi:hypothetical protein GCM10009850_084720 [Nonomuraea monospora]|uniref:Secreted protein n=1 Tax=Nonomuraea monospora TaxID=568818 RepID=A0ABP5PMV4_9ACTN